MEDKESSLGMGRGGDAAAEYLETLHLTIVHIHSCEFNGTTHEAVE